MENIAVDFSDKMSESCLNVEHQGQLNDVNNTPKFAKNKLLTNLISENGGESDSSEPSAGSFKSRALYESFRGKPSTLERPRQKKRITSLGNNSSLSSTPNNHHLKLSKRISYDELLANNNNNNNENNGDFNKNAEESADQNNSLQKSYSIREKKPFNTDKNALSTVTHENIYKFALLKEDFKRVVSLKNLI